MFINSWLKQFAHNLNARQTKKRVLASKRRQSKNNLPAIVTEDLESRRLLSATGAGSVTTDSLEAESNSTHILVMLEDGASSADFVSATSSWQAGTYSFDTPGLMQIALQDGVTVAEAIAAAEANPMVAFAEPDYQVTLDDFQAEAVPNDPQFSDLYGLNNTGQTGGIADADIDALEAWDINTGNANTLVAVIDTGVDYNHPDLAANMWVNPGEIAGNGIDDDGNGFVDDIHGYDFFSDDADPFDENGHGTHVAGTIGAVGDNGIGVVGVNHDVSIMALRFLGPSGSGSISDALKSLEYAVANGAVISNNSWGGGGFSASFEAALQAANEAGHIFVAAAGNSSSNNDNSPHYPSSYEVPNVVAVAATDSSDQLASFSSFGATTVDLAAPGVAVVSTTPNNTYSSFSGTSMATPHVAGVMALVISQNPTLGHDQVIAQVFDSVDPLSNLDGIVATGGRLNAFNALNFNPSAGSISLDSATYEVGQDVVVTVSDIDLEGENSIQLTIASSSGDSESISLTEIAPGNFSGTIATAAGSGSSNGVLNVGAGDTITVSYNDANNGEGQPTIVTATAAVVSFSPVFNADFSDENGNGSLDGFTIDNSGATVEGLWHLSTGRGSQAGHSATHSVYFGTNEGPDGGGNYNVGDTAGNITSPTIDLTTANAARLKFNYVLGTESTATFDQASVQVSVNGGEFADVLTRSSGLANASEWTAVEVDLSAYVGNSVQIRFLFDTIDDILNDNEGFYVDDVSVEASVPNTAPPISDLMEILVGFSDSAGNAISEIQPGQTFFIDVFANDLRQNPAGVLSAFADVVFDSSLVTIGAIESVFDDFTSGTIGNGEVDEVGGLEATQPGSAGQQLVFKLQATALGVGALTVSTNAAEGQLSENQLFGLDGDVRTQTVFGANTIQIVNATPDLVVTQFSLSDSHVNKGEALLNATFQNLGEGPSGGYIAQVVLSKDDIIGNADDVIVKNYGLASLEPGQTFSATDFPVNLPKDVLYADALADDPANLGVGHSSTSTHTLAIVLDPNGVIDELSEANNVAKDQMTYFPWDTNGDGTITPTDVGFLVNRLGGEDAEADLDGNGVVTPSEVTAAVNRIGYLVNSNPQGQADNADGASIAESLASQAAAESGPVAGMIVDFTDLNGVPLETVVSGQDFLISVYIEDLRTIGNEMGAISSFADLLYDSSLVEVTGIDYAFNTFTMGNIDNVNGELDEVGGVDLMLSGTSDRSPQLVFTATAKATGKGLLNVETTASDSLTGETTLFGLDGDQRNNIDYGSGSIMIQDQNSPIQFTDGVITIELETASVLAIGTHPENASQLAVYLNYQLVDTGMIPVDSVTGFNINGSGGDDVISLAGITTEGFSNLTSIQVNAGHGADKFFGSEFADHVDGGTGWDSLNGGLGNDVLIGGNGYDRLSGEAGDDVLDGGNGWDWLFGADGNDHLKGGSGRDRLLGQAGDDTLEGGNGYDLLLGDIGNDVLKGGNHRDTIVGGLGDDQLDGGRGHDAMSGGQGNDWMFGGAGRDSMDGGDGNDTMYGGTGFDILMGRAGNDAIAGQGHDDTIAGGEGNDQIAALAHEIDEAYAFDAWWLNL